MGYGLSGIICLKSEHNNKYLRYIHTGNFQTHGLVQFAEDTPFGAFSQFEVVKACCDPSLIHLKSRYSNKFLVRWSPNQYWVSATADEPNENENSWSCTLFKPNIIQSGVTTKVRLMHVQLGRYANCHWNHAQPFTSCLYLGSKDVSCDACDVVTIIDWAALHKLPKFVAFKGANNKFIGSYIFRGKKCLQISYTNPYDPMVAQEIVPNQDGTICIKSKYNGKFWRVGDEDFIVADVEPASVKNNPSAMFRVNVMDFNVVRILSVSNTLYLRGFSAAGYIDMMKAPVFGIDGWSSLTVMDLER